MFELLNIFMGIVQQALTFQSIAAGTACLLVIVLQRLRDVVMYHEPNVWLVDAHAESDGCDNYIYLFEQELILTLGANRTFQASMIGNRADAIGLQRIGEFFGSFTVERVNDPALTLH